MSRGHIAMLLGNGYRPDLRVLKAARTLGEASPGEPYLYS